MQGLLLAALRFLCCVAVGLLVASFLVALEKQALSAAATELYSAGSALLIASGHGPGRPSFPP